MAVEQARRHLDNCAHTSGGLQNEYHTGTANGAFASPKIFTQRTTCVEPVKYWTVS